MQRADDMMETNAVGGSCYFVHSLYGVFSNITSQIGFKLKQVVIVVTSCQNLPAADKLYLAFG